MKYTGTKEDLQREAAGVAKAMGEGFPRQLHFAIILQDVTTGATAIAARGTKENAIAFVEALLAKLKGTP